MRDAKWVLALGALLLFPTLAAGDVTTRFEIYGARTIDQIETLSDMGFNQMILEDPSLVGPATQRGIAVVQPNWWNVDTPWSMIDGQLAAAARIPGLVSVNMMDEPHVNGLARHPPDLYQSIRARSIARGYSMPLSLTVYGPHPNWTLEERAAFRGYIAAIDFLRIDPYPVVANRPLATVYLWMEAARDIMAQEGRPLPLTVILQAWTLGDDPSGVPQLPEIAAIRVMAFLALLGEADAISFYEYRPDVWARKPGFTEGFRDMMNEIAAVARSLSGCHLARRLSDEGFFQATYDCTDGRQGEFRINTSQVSTLEDLPPLTIAQFRDLPH